MAMGAVALCSPEIVHLAHPWPRYRNIFGGDNEFEFYQQSSPFFFRGEDPSQPVFCKVWRQGDDAVDEIDAERESSLLRHAFNCGVSVVEQGQVNTTMTDAFSIGKWLSAFMEKFAKHLDERVRVVAEGLCMCDVPSRMSLQDAYDILKREGSRRKKAKTSAEHPS